ncbi:hypothetical protein PHLCEN_2v8885 [Hermanssonia centrifuga]|uniref:Lectin n=1 Tax=Hermanssonia centrifuga TaxID=98765 RepID=A0A2R6NS99_9APHY|nr:hypothetical protein PHLCEN_2v8885 [Hermanssonia centrifuga]
MSTLPDTQENALPPTVWNLKPVQSAANIAGKIIPGLYSLQSVACDNFVGLSNDEKTIACWPSSHFSKSGTRLWEIAALGDGFTIRLQGTDRYCTMQTGVGKGHAVSLSSIPAAWKIKPLYHGAHFGESRYQ